MSVSIDMDMCIGCNLCVPVCPNRAIAERQDNNGAPMWLVLTDLCSECKGDFYDTKQCLDVCPMGEMDCITVLPENEESEAELTAKGRRLGAYRESQGYPRNYSYTANTDLAPAPGEFGPLPPDSFVA